MKTALLFGLLLAFPLAATAQFTAYNDFVTDYVASATNVTRNQAAGTHALKDFATGATVMPTMTITRYNLSTDGSGPAAEISGGDALAIFGGKVAGLGKCMAPSSGWYFNMEFSGLDVNKTYNVATFTDRGGTTYDNKRWANISLVNADSASSTYACSVGAGSYQISPTSVSQDSGYNTVDGFVAKWTDIVPGPDGKFSIYFRAAITAEVPAQYQGGMSSGSGYGPAGLMLEETVPLPPNAVIILPAQINSVVGGATVSGTVSIPAGSNASADVNVTLTSSDPTVADLVGSTAGVLQLVFPQGGPVQQDIQIDIGQAGSATITSTNDAGLLDGTQTVTVGAGAVTLAPTSVTAPSGAIRPVVVSISPGANDTRPVQVTVTSDSASTADPVGSSGGVLQLVFAQGAATQQTVNLLLGTVGSAIVSTTNDGGLADPANLPVTVQTGAVTMSPTSISTLPASIRPVTVAITAGANDSRAITVTLASDDPTVADMAGATGGVLQLTFAQGAGNTQVVNVQLGAVVGTATTIWAANDGGLTSPAGLAVSVVNLRSWVIPIMELQGEGGINGPDPTKSWQMVATGGYDDGVRPGVGSYPLDGRYYWRLWDPGLVWQRVYWRFDAADIPSQPRLYTIECWVPYLGEGDPKSWKQIDVMINGINTPAGWNQAMVPTNGHNQWIKKGQLGGAETEGGWKPAGPGPNAPAGPECATAMTGSYLWLKKGSELYMDGSTAVGFKYGVSALRITEVESAAPVCDPPATDGPLDLRCIGNADPLYTIGEGFGRGYEAHVDGNALAVSGYRWPCNDNSTNVLPIAEGVGLPYAPETPDSAMYTAQLPTGDVSFNLRYRGMNSLKWRNDGSGAFSRENVFTLNSVPDRDFVSGRFGRLYVLTTKAGNSGKLRVEKVYTDGTSDVTEAQLYDWYNQDGDAGSMAVGVDGRLRSAAADVLGFQRLNSDGLAPGGWGPGSNGGTHSGAFLFVHPVDIDRSRILAQVKFSLAELDTYGGELVIVGVTLEASPCSNQPFDSVGGEPNDTGPDGSVDQVDFGAFQACWSGTLEYENRARCRCFDVDGNGKIDEYDLGKFEACATGPGVGPSPVGCELP